MKEIVTEVEYHRVEVGRWVLQTLPTSFRTKAKILVVASKDLYDTADFSLCRSLPLCSSYLASLLVL